MTQTIADVKSKIRDVVDFPKEGIIFRDITTALKEPETLKIMIDYLCEQFKDIKIDYIAGIESRGFIFGMPMAYKLNAGFVPIRKPKKLPAATYSQEYALEYGTDTIEIHQDALPEGANVLIVDDLLATGGTAEAACKLVIPSPLYKRKCEEPEERGIRYYCILWGCLLPHTLLHCHTTYY